MVVLHPSNELIRGAQDSHSVLLGLGSWLDWLLLGALRSIISYNHVNCCVPMLGALDVDRMLLCMLSS